MKPAVNSKICKIEYHNGSYLLLFVKRQKWNYETSYQ